MATLINVNVDTQVLEKSKIILSRLGLNMNTAINMFLTEVVKNNGIPFEIENPKPSKELLKAIKEGEDILSGKIKAKGYHSVKKLIEDLES